MNSTSIPPFSQNSFQSGSAVTCWNRLVYHSITSGGVPAFRANPRHIYSLFSVVTPSSAKVGALGKASNLSSLETAAMYKSGLPRASRGLPT